MPVTNLSNSVVTDMSTTVQNYQVRNMQTDAAQDNDETTWINQNAAKYLGYYKTIPELKKAIDAFATWVVGRGFITDVENSVVLDHVTGWGEDTFNSIIWNMLACKKIYGDAFAEIIRDEKTGKLLNLKVLDPATIRIVVDRKGLVTRYEQVTKRGKKTDIVPFQPEEILHLCNDRIADEIHGTSVIECCEGIILARNEAIVDYRKVLHRNIVPVRIIEVDSDNTAKIAVLKAQYQQAVDKGEVLIVPKGNVQISDSKSPITDPIAWIQYLENFFYQAVGIPKIILGGSAGETESSAKIGYTTFDQTYIREQTELTADLWNQLYMKIEFNKPQSLMDNLQIDQSKDGQGFQQNDMMLGRGE